LAALFSAVEASGRNRKPGFSGADLAGTKFASVAARWEDSEMQADLTMGNLASALTFESEEAALIAELQAGSEEAFAWLIARYHQPIFSLLARAVQDRDAAADLTQEVFVKVFRGVGSFHGESSLRTWIYRIALHEASNHRRWWTRHRQAEVPIEQEMGESENGQPVLLKEMLVDSAESPYELALHDENRARVEAALSKVPEPFRSTLILRDIEGFVYEEVAEMQGVNLGTVKSRLVRGRAALKEILTAPAQASVLQRARDLKCSWERRHDERLQCNAD
jgi:RNA polymerase sigma-70 factor, ECF subfamily